MKKLIGILAFIVLTACFTVSVCASEITQYLNLFDGISMSDPMSKADAAVVISRLLNLRGANSSATFEDVTKEHPDYAPIGAVASLGIISGDNTGCFYPESNLSYIQALKMFVEALGYGDYADAKGGWYTGYMAVAHQLKLTDGISCDFDSEITGKIFETITENALDVSLMLPVGFGDTVTYSSSTGETVLSYYHNINRGEGVIKGTSSVNLTDISLGDCDVLIDDKIYYSKDMIFDTVVGYFAEYFYRKNASNKHEILSFSAKENNTITINSEDIEYADIGYIKYYDYQTGKEKNVSISPTAYISLNGMPIRNLKASDFTSPDTTVTVIDNDSSGGYDVCLIKRMKTIVVNSVDKSAKKIYGMYKQRTGDGILQAYNLDLNDVDYIITDEFGEKMEIEELAVWDVLSVYVSENGKKVMMEYSNSEVEGVIESIDNSPEGVRVMISDKWYICDNTLAENVELIAGTYGIFIFNSSDKISAAKTEESDLIKYGYMTDAIVDTGMDGEMLIKVMCSSNEFKVFALAKKTEIDANLYSGTEEQLKIVNKILYKDSSLTPCVIRYRLNSDGKIVFVDTPERGVNESENTLTKYYNASQLLFVDSMIFGAKVPTNGSTTVFTAPLDAQTADDTYYGSYSVGDYFTYGYNYDFDAYRTNPDSHFPSVLVCLADNMKTGIDSYERAVIIDNVSAAINRDGDSFYKIKGFRDGQEVSYTTDDMEAFVNLKDKNGMPYKMVEGDVLRFAFDAKGRITGGELIYSAKDDAMIVSNPNNSNINDRFRVVMGTAYSIHDSNLFITTSSLAPDGSTEPSYNSIESYNMGKFTVVVYDKTLEDSVYVGTSDDILCYKSIGVGSKIFIHTHYTNPGVIYVIR